MMRVSSRTIAITEAQLNAWAIRFFPHMTLACGRMAVLSTLAQLPAIRREPNGVPSFSPALGNSPAAPRNPEGVAPPA